MPRIRVPHDSDDLDNQDDFKEFESIPKRESAITPDMARRQRDKEWGRVMHRYHRERTRGSNGKP